MSEEALAKEIKKIMEITGTSDPVKALKKARQMLKGRRTEHSRIVGTLSGLLDAMTMIKNIEQDAFLRGYKVGKESSKESEVIRKKKEELALKALDKMDIILSKMDGLLDLMAQSLGNIMLNQAKKQIQTQRKVKPKFKVVFKEK